MDMTSKINISPPKNKIVTLESILTMFAKGGAEVSLPDEVTTFYNTIVSGNIPERMPKELTDRDFLRGTIAHVIPFTMWQSLQKIGYFTVTTKVFANAMKQVVKDKVVLDPLAGAGFLAKSLREAGVKTIASDNNSWGLNGGIEKLDALDSLTKYGDKVDYLVISWADYGSDIDYKLLMSVRENYPHIKIIVIGEYEGATGSSKFWQAAKEIQPAESKILAGSYKSFDSLNDFPLICQ